MARTVFPILGITLLLTLLVAMPMAGQVFSPSPEPLNPTASEFGLSGLWKTISAETPPARSFGTSVWYDRINRNPGGLTISTIGEGVWVSLHDRFELGVQINMNRHILMRRADQLSFGQATLFTQRKAACRGCPLMQPPINMPGQAIPRLRIPQDPTLLTNQAGFYNLLPWVNRRLQTGFGEVVVSGKINLVSQARGGPLGLALRPWVGIPTRTNAQDLLNSGAQTGEFSAGMDILLTQNLGNVAAMHTNAGFAYIGSPDQGGRPLIGLRNVIPMRVGFNIPRTSRLQVVAEITTDNLVGGGTRNAFPRGASDGTIGFRAFPANWISINAAYRHTLNEFGGDKNGFVLMMASSSVPTAVAAPLVPPTVTCSAQPTSVQAGQMVRLTATASTTTGGTLTYTWSAPAGRIDGTGPEVRFDTTGLAPGSYTATVRVSDSAGGFADCTTTVVVEAPPKPNPPTASCAANKATVNPGEVVTFTGAGSSPDKRPLQYQWSISPAGALQGTGTSVTLDTTGLRSGAYTASLRVTDDRGLSADSTCSTTVVAPPPKPEMAKLNQCSFKARSSRVDNVCKAVLDDVALRLQSEADASAVVVGYAPAAKGRLATLGAERGSNVKQYLMKDKGVSAGRIEVRSATGENQAEIYLVPRGASYTGPGETVQERPTPTRPRARRRPAAKPAAEKPAAEEAAKPAAEKPAAPKPAGKAAAEKAAPEKKAAPKKQ